MSAEVEKCSIYFFDALQMKQFENCQNETLFETLQEKPKESQKYSGKELRKEYERKRQLRQRLVKTLGQYHAFQLGHGTSFNDFLDVLEKLTKRDYPKLVDFDGSEPLQIFIPKVFLTKCPEIIDGQEYSELKMSEDVDDKFQGHFDSFKGEDVERQCYESLKKYFAGKDESCLVIHSLPLQPMHTVCVLSGKTIKISSELRQRVHKVHVAPN